MAAKIVPVRPAPAGHSGAAIKARPVVKTEPTAKPIPDMKAVAVAKAMTESAVGAQLAAGKTAAEMAREAVHEMQNSMRSAPRKASHEAPGVARKGQDFAPEARQSAQEVALGMVKAAPSPAAIVPATTSEATIIPEPIPPESINTAVDEVAAVSTEAFEAGSAITSATPTPTVVPAATQLTTTALTTQKTLTQGMKTMMKSTEDFVAFGQANFEAFVRSGQIWSAGVQELTRQFASSAKASFDESVSTLKAITTAKSVREAMDLQSTFAKAALEKAMFESNKLTDASIKLTEQTLAPITARVTVAVESFGKTA
jgi:phasin family protein